MKKTGLIAIAGVVLILLGIILALLFNKTYTIVIDSNNGSDVTTIEVKSGDKITKPKEPTKEGFIFDGWYNGNEKYDFNEKVNANIVLKAKWTSVADQTNVVVTFDTDGGNTISSRTIKKGTTVTEPTIPTKTGYEFVEWQVNGQKFVFTTAINESITIKATWKEKSTPVETTKYTVTFNSNGGSTVGNVQVNEGTAVTKPSNPTRNGYTFQGWQLNGAAYDFTKEVTSDITLVASWKAVPVTYTYKWVKVENSTADQYKLYIVSSTGNYVRGTVTVNYIGGGSENFTIESTGKTFAYKTSTISSVTNVRVN